MAITPTVTSDNSKLQTQGAATAGQSGQSSPDGALFAALMVQSNADSAGGKPATLPVEAATNVAGVPSDTSVSALKTAVGNTAPVRFAVSVNDATPTDSTLEDFAVQMGIDRSLAHLLLTQTTNSNASTGTLPGTAPLSTQVVAPVTAAMNVATASAVDSTEVLNGGGSPSALLAAFSTANAIKLSKDGLTQAANNAKATATDSSIDATSPGAEANVLLTGAATAANPLSDEDLLKAKKGKSKTVAADSANYTSDPLFTLLKLSQEAHTLPSTSSPMPVVKSNSSTSTVGSPTVSSPQSGDQAVAQLGTLSTIADSALNPSSTAIHSVPTNSAALSFADTVGANVAVAGASAGQGPNITANPATSAILSELTGASVDPNSIVGVTAQQQPVTAAASPSMASQDWLRSLGATSADRAAFNQPVTTPAIEVNSAVNNSALTTPDGLTTSQSLTAQVLAAATPVTQPANIGAKLKVPTVLANETATVTSADTGQSLPNVTLNALSKAAMLVGAKAASGSSDVASSMVSATGLANDNSLAASMVQSGSTNSASTSSADAGAQTTLNTPIELPQPDKSYADRMDEFSAQVASRLLAQVKTEKYSVNLRVTPENLGPIAISLNVDGNKLSAHFGAAVPEVRALLQAALPNLKSNLESAGFNLGNTSFSQSGSGSGNPFANQFSGGSQTQAATLTAKTTESTIDPTPVSSASDGSSPHVLDVYA